MKKERKTFEEFLEEKYDEIDNDSNNSNEAWEGRRDNWFSNLDVQEMQDYGEEYGELMYEQGQSDQFKVDNENNE